MRVRPGFGETLPAMLRRRHGIPERRTLVAAGALVALVVAAVLVLDDPLDGKSQRVHRGGATPVFNTLYTPGLVEPVPARPGELQRYAARRGRLALEVSIRPLQLPPYAGDVSGILPVVAVGHMDRLRRRLPGFEVLDEGRARVNKAPGYQVGFRYGPRGDRSTGRDVLVVPPDEAGARAGAVISLRETRGGRRGEAVRPVVKAMRSAFRSFKFGADRDD